MASLLGWVTAASAAGEASEGAPRIRISTLALESDPTSQWAARVMIEAYRRLGMEPEFLSMPAERSLVSANAGETEAELYRKAGIEKGYPQLVMVPVPIATYEIVAFVPAASELSIVNWNSLAAARVAYVKGIKVIEENTGGLQFFPVAALAQAFGMLERGRVDVVLANRISGMAALRSLKLTGIEVRPQALVAFPVYHYLHTSRRALVPRLTQVLQDMTRERWMQKVQEDLLARY